VPTSQASRPPQWTAALGAPWVTLWVKSLEMAMASPAVIAKRLVGMAVAGPSVGRRDQQEMVRMVTEKVDACSEAVLATAAAVGSANQRLAASLARSAWTGSTPRWASLTGEVWSLSSQIAGRGISPFHRRVISNARRL
jgi:hypothetical protein